MSKIVLNDLTNTYNPVSINENFTRIETEFQNKVLYRNNPIGEANTLESDIDANSKSIYNVDNLTVSGTLSAGGINFDAINSALVWRGAWNGGTTYSLSDAVTHLGSSYIANTSNSGSTPPSASWDLLAQKGDIGSGIVSPPGGVTISDFSLTTLTPADYVVFPDTAPAGWNLLAGSCYLQFEVVSTNYYAANPNGHWAAVVRADPDVIATAVRGAGCAVGNLIGAPEGTLTNPGAQIETWANGLLPVTNRFLIPNAHSPSNKTLLDNVRYRFIIESVYMESGTRHIRLVVLRANLSKAAFDLEFDTGYVIDDNQYADMTKQGIVFGQVFEDNLLPWSLDFSNIRVIWGPAPTHNSSSIDRLSRYGASLDGDLSFTASRKIIFPFNAGPSLATSLTVQSSTPNTATAVVSKPNGTATASNMLFSNNSTSTTTYQAVTYGITGADGVIETFGLSATAPVLGINIGASNRVATFKTTGMRLLNGTVDIGTAINYGSGLYNFGGANADFHNTTNTLDIESICTVGVIRTFMSPTPTNEQVENSLRPLYCMFSELIADLRSKKVI